MSGVLPEPVPPEDWECCGSDCGDACVWELYYRDKAAYDKEQQQLAANRTADAKQPHTTDTAAISHPNQDTKGSPT